MKHNILLIFLLFTVILIGCSEPNAKLPSTSAPPANPDTRSPVVSNPSVPAEVTAPTGERPTPAAVDNPKPPEQTTPNDPVIVQSAPETNTDTEAVLEEISRELDNLTEVLKDIETSDAAWDQEVNQP